MTSARTFAINTVEVRGSNESLKLKSKLTRVLTDETFEDVLLLTQGTRRQIELKTSALLINAFHCEVDRKIWEVLEFDSNFKTMSTILTYNETGGQEEGPKRQGDLKLLTSNARAVETPKSKKETAGKIVKWLHFVHVFFKSNQ